MGNPSYDARRDAERAEADQRKSQAEAGAAAFDALTDFMRGKAQLSVWPMIGQVGSANGWNIRLVRDVK